MKIGIAGGIGSGKSYVCRLIRQRGFEVYDCDSAAKRLIRTDPDIRRQLTALIGPDAYTPEGQLNKAVVARFLLASDANSAAIDAIVHPAVFRDFEASGLQWLESAIMYESGISRLMDRVIVVTAPLEVRGTRLDGQAAPAGRGRRPRRLRARQRRRGRHRTTIKQHYRTMQQTILAIAGKPGLYKLVSRGSNNLIVEALDATHKRMPAFATDRITSLADIAMFTETDDVPLMDVLDNLKTLENGKKASINEKKATGDELRAYFTKVLPEWDQERVHNSDIKKLITWYNILVEAGITDFKEEMSPTDGDNIDDRK